MTRNQRTAVGLKSFEGVMSMFLLLYISVCFLSSSNVMSVLGAAVPGGCEDIASPSCQEELRPHYCYLEHNRNLCCRTCESYRTSDPDCLYGDYYSHIVRRGADGENRTYTCDSYIKFYGQHHCRVDQQFRQYCCQSCRDVTTG